MSSFDGKVVAITGGASGIGLALAHLLASRGAKLSIADVSEQNLDKAAQNLKQSRSDVEVLTRKVDVRDLASMHDWMKATVEKFGRVDGAANLAGVWGKGLVSDIEEDVWDFVIDVNLKVRPSHVQPAT
jgi:NAD(P)-dependent dehydrogenase (short-subunit alcohol dehydrogenase family)